MSIASSTLTHSPEHVWRIDGYSRLAPGMSQHFTTPVAIGEQTWQPSFTNGSDRFPTRFVFYIGLTKNETKQPMFIDLVWSVLDPVTKKPITGMTYKLPNAPQRYDEVGQCWGIGGPLLSDIKVGSRANPNDVLLISWHILFTDNVHFNSEAIRQTRFESDMTKMLAENKGDVVIHCAGGKSKSAHRVILEARSDVFAAIMRSGMSESLDGSIHLDDVDLPVLEALLHYIYTGQVVKNIPDGLLGVAHRFQLDELVESCVANIVLNLSLDNVILCHSMATKYNLASLTKVCEQFMQADATRSQDLIAGLDPDSLSADSLRATMKSLAQLTGKKRKQPETTEPDGQQGAKRAKT